ncbi:hypothetical protein [Flammeovirga agarivorans]|uniref:Uncharacterized protein n=1 Tax=Flammeovirga agarivorans TaxID=2726742 RepID=A0A7X8XYE9_9BACT|nr:hypothetical protein [Flammeovirga agarivorans]NLR94053.1 hypothetical protein [Flammeovirga agarivorans]
MKTVVISILVALVLSSCSSKNEPTPQPTRIVEYMEMEWNVTYVNTWDANVKLIRHYDNRPKGMTATVDGNSYRVGISSRSNSNLIIITDVNDNNNSIEVVDKWTKEAK